MCNRMLAGLGVTIALLVSGCPESKVDPIEETTPVAQPEPAAKPEPVEEAAEKPKGPLETVRGKLDIAGAKANERLEKAAEVNE